MEELKKLPMELEAHILELNRQINENEARAYWINLRDNVKSSKTIYCYCSNRLQDELRTIHMFEELRHLTHIMTRPRNIYNV